MSDLTLSTPDVVTPCPICGDMGFVTLDVPVGHPDFGKAFPCVCQAKKVKERQAARFQALGTMKGYEDKTFETFQIDYDGVGTDDLLLKHIFAPISVVRRQSLTEEHLSQINTAAELAYGYAQEPHGWLLLRGSYGTGKTHLAAAIARWRLVNHEPVLFTTAPDLLDHLRATYGPSSEIAYDAYFESVRNAPLLVLDDLGAENQTPWALEKMYQLFSHRHALRLSTVVTTNCDPESFDPRIRSRLLDQSLTRSVTLAVPDHRSPITTWQEMDLTNLERYRNMTFASFDLRREENLPDADIKRLLRTVKTAQDFALNPLRWLVILGEPGSGKTHLAAAIGHERKQRGHVVVFATTSELLDHLRTTFSPGSAVRYDKRMTEIKMAGLLILDDLTVDKALSSWARDKLYEILLYRYDYHLPTVITSSQPLDEMDARLRSRLKNEDHSVVEAITVSGYPGRTGIRRAAPPKRLKS